MLEPLQPVVELEGRAERSYPPASAPASSRLAEIRPEVSCAAWTLCISSLAWHDDHRWKAMRDPQGKPAIPGDTAIWTPRLALSALGIEDAAEMAGVLDDVSLHEFIGGHPASAAELEGRYRRWVVGPREPGRRWLNWVVRERDGRGVVGTMQATIKTGDDGDISADVAWVIGTPWQGRGYWPSFRD